MLVTTTENITHGIGDPIVDAALLRNRQADYFSNVAPPMGSRATAADLLRHMADLDDLMVEAYGEHQALAAVRAAIAAEMDRTQRELALLGVSIPEAF